MNFIRIFLYDLPYLSMFNGGVMDLPAYFYFQKKKHICSLYTIYIHTKLLPHEIVMLAQPKASIGWTTLFFFVEIVIIFAVPFGIWYH